MTKLRTSIPMLAACVAAAACGGQIQVQVLDDESNPVEDLEIQFIPFDRDSLFAHLVAAATNPEPEVPSDLEEALEEEGELQAAWSAAESEWNDVRGEMRSITDRMDSLDDRSSEYRDLFAQFGDLEDREAVLNRERQRAFDAFTAAQQANAQAVDSICIVIGAWEDVAFADYGDVEDDLLGMVGRDVYTDTTDVDGVASASGGPWYVHARRATVVGELYWNVEVEAGAADTVKLREADAELRTGVRQRC